jgi:hypothetical protein
MGSVNNILNRVDALNDQNAGIFKRVIQTRATNLFVTAPMELSQAVLNTFMTPVHLTGAILKTATKAVAFITGSQSVKNLEAKLPGFCDLLRTIKNIFANAIGAFLSATIGVLYPKGNFKIHCALGLAINQRQEAINAALAKKQIEETQLQIELNEEDELTAEELELLENLTLAFAMARQLEIEAEQAAESTTKATEHTFVSIGNTLYQSAEQLEEAECQLGTEINKTHELEKIELEEASFGNTLNSIYESGENLLSQTYNAITNS